MKEHARFTSSSLRATGRASLLAVLLLTSLPHAPALGAERTTLTLAEAIDRSLAHAPRLQAMDAREHIALASSREKRARRFPVLDLSAGYTRSSDVPELTLRLPDGPPRTIFPNIPDAYRSRIDGTLPLFTWGEISADIRSAARELEATRLDRTATRSALVLETTTAYWSLATARAEVRVLRRALEAFDVHARDARNREELGLASRNEVLAVEVERDQAELDRLAAEHDAAVLENDLRRLAGLPAGGEIVLADTLGQPVDTGTTPDRVAHGLAARPELGAARARFQAAEWSARSQRAARLPRLSLVGGVEIARPNRRFLPLEDEWNDGWDAGVTLSWRLFDGGRLAASAARARAQAVLLDRSADDLEESIELDIESRFLERETARASVPVAARRVDAAEENRRVTHDRYLEGLAPSSELLDAEVQLLRAHLSHARALAGLRVADARLRHALGE